MIAVWFSCGAASAVALKLAIEKYGHEEVRALNTPVDEEHPDNRRFCRDVGEWLNIDIEEVVHPRWGTSAEHVWDKNRFMAGPHGAPCTRLLKREARQLWERENEVDWHVFGFTIEERKRHERFVLTERENVDPVLIDARYSRTMCFDEIGRAGINLPEIYNLGFPNANCIGCVKSASPTYWNLVRRTFPEVFERRATQSREIGARLVKVGGARIFLDELDPNAKGGRIKSMPECGLFCEET